MKIYLIGMPGSGKSTIGKKLALKLGFEYVDTDLLIVQMQNMSVEDIFSTYGEEYFRALERKVLNCLFNKSNVVIATGGGTPCFFDNMQLINQNGITVFLDVNTEALCERLYNETNNRPLLKGKSKEELFSFIKEKREARMMYYNMAQITIKGDNILAEDVLKMIQQNRKS